MRVHSILHVLTIFIFISFSSSLSLSSDTITSTQSLTSNQTLVSPGQVFELGFFTPGNSNQWFLGIWYKNIRERTYVWVANKDNPLTNPTGIFKVGNKGNIIVLDQDVTLKWSSKETKSSHPVVVKLLDTGNLVVKEEHENSDNYLWQSFDYPTDTLLPGMKLGWDFKNNIERHLTAWKSSNDPSTGDYSFKLDFHGFPEIFLIHKQDRKYRSGPWVGTIFSGVPEMKPSTEFDFVFVTTKDEVFYSYSVRKQGLFSRLVLNSSGKLWRYSWLEDRQRWTQFWYAPKDRCDDYLECGPFGICDTNASPVCKCAHGFMPKKPQAWQLRDGSDGCVRKTELDCQFDGFLKLTEMKLPETSKAVVNFEMGLDDCRDACLRNCSCSGYANSNVSHGGSGCVMWIGELLDMREYAEDGGQDLYVRVSASDIDSDNHNNRTAVIVSVAVISGIALLAFISYLVIRRRRISRTKKDQTDHQEKNLYEEYVRDADEEDLDLPYFDLETITTATDNFSLENKIGEGGFGSVYKGVLPSEQEIAVKRLSKDSGQGLKEFKNEVILISKLQHRNLVRLLGCCIHREERMLVYEYMPNRSLDFYLFDKTRSALVNWKKRFEIIIGIARGLLYLHRDSRLRIIHRDLKASNILLDLNMSPKISDFGLARTFGADQTEANTLRIIGTYGYMSPEYAIDGQFSEKSDVFSFGVLVLEIVSGKKNRGFNHPDHDMNLLGHAWKLWSEGRSLDLVDPSLDEAFTASELLKCLQVGLLCVQQRPEDRPTMSSTLLMLDSENSLLSQPKQPGFYTERFFADKDSSSTGNASYASNEITMSMLQGR